MKLLKAKLLIEVECSDCKGEGKCYITPSKALEPTKSVWCSTCDGSGYEETRISLNTLKHLLEGGKL